MTAYAKGRQIFKTLLYEWQPFCGDTCIVPHFQTLLYYTPPDSDVYRHIDLSNARTDELADLYAACKPAEFNLNGEIVLDEASKKMDIDSFSTLFDPHNLGIFEQVSSELRTELGDGITEMELHKLNVYGEGDFSKPHKDARRSENMVGSLVIVLPSRHDGGQLVLRQGDEYEWKVDFADKFAAATDPMVCFVAFLGDVEHEVLPVTSGYCVTLTYNLYEDKHRHPNISYLPTPFHERLKGALVELVNNKSVLPEGGYLGFGLVHEYVCGKGREIRESLHHLKGADQILATICEELGLQYSLWLLYRDLRDAGINLIVDRWLTSYMECGDEGDNFFEFALQGLDTSNVEGVEIIGHPFNRSVLDEDYLEVFRPFYRDPVTKILEVRPMSSVNLETVYPQYGNSPTLEFVYGHASMLISLDPVASRKELVL